MCSKQCVCKGKDVSLMDGSGMVFFVYYVDQLQIVALTNL